MTEHKKPLAGIKVIDLTQIYQGPYAAFLFAMAGADVSRCGDLLGKDVVYVYDNEPRNSQITGRIQKHIKAGDSVVIWPREVKEKDVNDMLLAGRDVNSVVQSNVYNGLKSTLKLNEWKK